METGGGELDASISAALTMTIMKANMGFSGLFRFLFLKLPNISMLRSGSGSGVCGTKVEKVGLRMLVSVADICVASKCMGAPAVDPTLLGSYVTA
jgi:hypothetical protein